MDSHNKMPRSTVVSDQIFDKDDGHQPGFVREVEHTTATASRPQLTSHALNTTIKGPPPTGTQASSPDDVEDLVEDENTRLRRRIKQLEERNETQMAFIQILMQGSSKK